MDVDREACRRVGRAISELELRVDPFTDPSQYPPEGEPAEWVARYFIFMVAVDHRTHPPGGVYEAELDGRVYRGASLLYRLGVEAYLRDRGFFSPEHMAEVTGEEVERWLSRRGARVSRPWERAELLRDLAEGLLELYDGRVLELIRKSRSRLYAPWRGLVERLKAFRAYMDPVEKKPFLLVKFLERRGLFKAEDRVRLQVPVDNHLTRVALRTGIVKPSQAELELLAHCREAEVEEDIAIRAAVRLAWRLVSMEAGVSPLLLDDLLWLIGKRVCRARPLCELAAGLPSGSGGCPLRAACAAYLGLAEPLLEHKFTTYWY